MYIYAFAYVMSSSVFRNLELRCLLSYRLMDDKLYKYPVDKDKLILISSYFVKQKIERIESQKKEMYFL